MPRNLQSIDDVIATLEAYVRENEAANSPLGYFSALYLKVTKQVKKGIAEDFFAQGKRMERLDVIFVSRYIEAYDAYQQQQTITLSWERAFTLGQGYWPIVLQHLLIGMNAHINLDLGIAAATVMIGQPIGDLHGDFNKINQVLSRLVGEVQDELADIWPTLYWILRKTGQIDDKLVDFSMEIARDSAWRFAQALAAVPQDQWPQMIAERDQKIAKYANAISDPGWLINLALKFIRLGERGTVAEKVAIMNRQL